MNKKEALEILNNLPKSDKPSKLNPSLTINQGIAILINGLKEQSDTYILPRWYEKRIYQISRNQKRPRY